MPDEIRIHYRSFSRSESNLAAFLMATPLFVEKAQPPFPSCVSSPGIWTGGSHHYAPLIQQGRLGRKDRKSTRLNSSHGYISYAVFCLKKKKNTTKTHIVTNIDK